MATDGEVEYTVQITEMETRLTRLKIAADNKAEQEMEYAKEISEIQPKFEELEISRIQTG